MWANRLPPELRELYTIERDIVILDNKPSHFNLLKSYMKAYDVFKDYNWPKTRTEVKRVPR